MHGAKLCRQPDALSTPHPNCILWQEPIPPSLDQTQDHAPDIKHKKKNNPQIPQPHLHSSQHMLFYLHGVCRILQHFHGALTVDPTMLSSTFLHRVRIHGLLRLSQTSLLLPLTPRRRLCIPLWITPAGCFSPSGRMPRTPKTSPRSATRACSTYMTWRRTI